MIAAPLPNRWPQVSCWNRLKVSPLSVRAALVGLAYFATALAGIELTRSAGNVAAVWPANAIVLAVLVHTGLREWKFLLAAAAAANIAANLVFGNSLPVAAGLCAANIVEIIVGATLVRLLLGHRLGPVSVSQFIQIFSLAGLIAPVFGALLGASVIAYAFGTPYVSVWVTWWVADAMGVLIFGPAFFLLDREFIRHHAPGVRLAEACATIVGTAAACGAIFVYASLPGLFIIPILMMWSALRFGLSMTSVVGVGVTVVVIGLTVNGMGVVAQMPGLDGGDQIIFLQLLLAGSILPSLLVASALGERDRTNGILSKRSRAIEISNRRLAIFAEQRETLLAELQHRVKNSLQVVVSLLNIRADEVRSPPARTALSEAAHGISAMALIYRFLYTGAHVDRVDLAAYLPELVTNLEHVHRTARRGVTIEVSTDAITVPLEVATPLALIVNELLTNAIKHGGGDGEARIRVDASRAGEDNDICLLRVSDNGQGLGEGIDLEKPESTGFEIVQSLVYQIGGRIAARNEGGAMFELSFPLPDSGARSLWGESR